MEMRFEVYLTQKMWKMKYWIFRNMIKKYHTEIN